MPRFDPAEALHLGRKHGISTLKCVPAMLTDILETDQPVPFDSIIYGAAPTPMPQIERALDRYGPILMQLYGQSEAPVTITSLQKHDHAKPGPHRASVGRPWRTVDVQVVDADGVRVPDGELGEVIVRGGHLMEGYYGRPDLTAEVLRDGWLWTRDMAVRDEAGYIYLRGRRDEMINSGGYNIAPREVEDVVVQHPAVEECVATGVSHDHWGQQVQVFVLRKPDLPVDAGELVAFCKPRLGFRTPSSVVFVETMPRTPYGKVDRVRMLQSTGLDGPEPR
ncbi:MAG: AMP-binding protein [Propionibacteriales bacterium]|nr:AMP-binding protein [Propionibacteriales bacterium]